MQSQTDTKVQQLPTPADFHAALAEGTAGYVKASYIYVDILSREPGFRDELRTKGFSAQQLNMLERLGRRAMKPDLFLSMNAGRVALSRCLMSDQERFSTEPVAVFDPAEVEERLIRVDELDQEQIRMVFARDSIRSVAQQRTWWSGKHQPPAPAEADLSYRIRKDHVDILKPMTVRKATLLDWLLQIA